MFAFVRDAVALVAVGSFVAMIGLWSAGLHGLA
jgi:hypothetical protein